MAHNTTIHDDGLVNGWPQFHVTCEEDDFTTFPVNNWPEAKDSASWHADQNGGVVVNPDPPPPTPPAMS